jgi:hypothetical protein
MDSLILGAQTKRSVSFLARSGLFDNPLVGKVLDSCGVIPLYRKTDGPTPEGGNLDAFRKAYELLEEGGALGVFPEGRNAPERHVRDIKTGTARIALGAEARQSFKLGVQIVPVGLNFERRERSLSGVLVRFGAPIDVREYQDAYKNDSREAVRSLTAAIQDGIRTAAVHLHQATHDELLRDIYSIYGGVLIDELAVGRFDTRSTPGRLLDAARGMDRERNNLEDVFTAKQHIADAIEHFENTDPKLVSSVRVSVAKYQTRLAAAKLRLDFADRRPETLSRRKEATKLLATGALLSPLFVWGVLHNEVPRQLVKSLAAQPKDEAIRGATRLAASLLAYPSFYTAYVALLWLYLTQDLVVLGTYLMTLPIAGWWAQRYRRMIHLSRKRFILRELFSTRRGLVQRLLQQRDQLRAMFEHLRRRYRKATGARLL